MSGSANIWSTSPEPALEVHLLGLADFDACLYLQERLATEIALRTDANGHLLVCEHLPLITVGREGSQAHIVCAPSELRSRQLRVRWLNRGGGCVMHVPGQLAAYPILPLDRKGLGLATFRELLQQAVVDVCAEFRVSAELLGFPAGVGCRGGQVAQVGVAVRSHVSSHGIYLNVNPQIDALRLVRFPGVRNTSLAAERRQPLTMSGVRESLIRCLAAQLGYARYHLHTGHPLLRPVRRVMAYA
ncbi:MAG: lipoyl(octanoyl) transferase LipB [Planctomycetaceae bacterium]